MADDWQESADAVNRAVTGVVESLEDLFDKERTVYGGASLAEGTFGALGIGKGFRFPSVEDANKIINSFKDRQESIEKRKKLIAEAYAILDRPFAEDPASVSYIDRARGSLEKLAELNDSALKYVDNYVDKIESIKRSKMNDEEEISNTFDRSGGAN
ncbi:hypothetical protein [Haloechinothrix halophila]|uniref:hypothetical protein n=1 Tax=Haloechinothrix halophila TaxID=1069073 RepID=UPI000408B8F4|nr:hypothetical protein [Haloechinothrix halophila]